MVSNKNEKQAEKLKREIEKLKAEMRRKAATKDKFLLDEEVQKISRKLDKKIIEYHSIA